MSLKNTITLATLLPLLLLSSAVFAGGDGIKYSGTFSSLEYHEESGDLAGEEIKIVWTRKGFQGVMQIAEGGPSELMLIKPVFNENDVSFDVKYLGASGVFKGKIDNNGIKGSIKFETGGEAELNLKRKHSYWD